MRRKGSAVVRCGTCSACQNPHRKQKCQLVKDGDQDQSMAAFDLLDLAGSGSFPSSVCTAAPQSSGSGLTRSPVVGSGTPRNHSLPPVIIPPFLPAQPHVLTLSPALRYSRQTTTPLVPGSVALLFSAMSNNTPMSFDSTNGHTIKMTPPPLLANFSPPGQDSGVPHTVASMPIPSAVKKCDDKSVDALKLLAQLTTVHSII